MIRKVNVRSFAPFAQLIGARTVVVAQRQYGIANGSSFIALFVTARGSRRQTFFIVRRRPFGTMQIGVRFVRYFVITMNIIRVTRRALSAIIPIVTTFRRVPIRTNIVIPLTTLNGFIPRRR